LTLIADFYVLCKVCGVDERSFKVVILRCPNITVDFYVLTMTRGGNKIVTHCTKLNFMYVFSRALESDCYVGGRCRSSSNYWVTKTWRSDLTWTELCTASWATRKFAAKRTRLAWRLCWGA